MNTQPRHELVLLGKNELGQHLYCPLCKRYTIVGEEERIVVAAGEAGVIHYWTATITLEPEREPVVVRK